MFSPALDDLHHMNGHQASRDKGVPLVGQLPRIHVSQIASSGCAVAEAGKAT